MYECKNNNNEQVQMESGHKNNFIFLFQKIYNFLKITL